MNRLITVLSILGLLGSCSIGGVFFAFSSFVMRALGRLPAEHGLAAMQAINVTVINPHFLGAFLGTAAISLGAIVLGAMEWGQPGAAFHVGGGALYLVGTFLVTMRCNVPRNDALARLAPGDAAAADAWRRYVSQWTRWNHVRTAAALLAALSFCIGLLQRETW